MTKNQSMIIALAQEKGVIRPRDVVSLGVDRSSLRSLISRGLLRKDGRGLYSLNGFDVTEAHSLVEAVSLQTKAVVCLLSALSFHELGTQLPHQVWLAIPRGTRPAKIETVPVHVTVLSDESYEAGIEVHQLEGVKVPVYSVAKTVADCFKFRNRVGLDVALEALSEALHERRCKRDDIMRFAEINRVDKVIRPYMEAFSV